MTWPRLPHAPVLPIGIKLVIEYADAVVRYRSVSFLSLTVPQGDNVIDRYQDDSYREIPDVAHLGDTIARRREALGITQAQLAFSIGVNRRVIGELERGKETVRLGIAIRALTAVGVRLYVEPWQ